MGFPSVQKAPAAQMMGRGFNGQFIRTNGPRASCNLNGIEKVNGHLPTSISHKGNTYQLS